MDVRRKFCGVPVLFLSMFVGLCSLPRVTIADDAAPATRIEVRGNAVVASGYETIAGAEHEYSFESEQFSSTHLIDALMSLPGIESSGQGGWLQTFSIRGVSGQRVSTLLAGIPIYTERRAGTSAHFLAPELLGAARLIAGPATAIYGNGGIGGVVQLSPASAKGIDVSGSWATVNSSRQLSVLTGSEELTMGVAFRQQENSEASDGSELNDHGERINALFSQKLNSRAGEIEWFVLPSYLSDVGRANADYFNGKITETPEEWHLPIRFSLNHDSGIQAAAWVHAHSMTTDTLRVARDLNRVENESLDFGVNAHWVGTQSDWDDRLGIEVAARRGVNAVETLTRLSDGAQTYRDALGNGDERIIGLFYEWETRGERHAFQAGARWSHIVQSADGYQEATDHAFAAHLGWRIYSNDTWSVGAGLGSASRFPSLTERFYNGMTPRGDLLGNASLVPEQSLGGDINALYKATIGTLTAQAYVQDFSDYIERINLPNGARTYVNLTEGIITGADVSFRASFNAIWYGELGVQFVRGEDGDGLSLSQIPADAVRLGVGVQWSRCEIDLRWTWRDSKEDIGSDEFTLSQTNYGDLQGRCELTQSLQLNLKLTNASDQLYRMNADDQSPFAVGRNVSIGIEWRL